MKKSSNTQKKLKELETMYQNAICNSFSSHSQICRFPVKNTDVCRTQRMRHVIHEFLESSLDKV